MLSFELDPSLEETADLVSNADVFTLEETADLVSNADVFTLARVPTASRA